MDILDIALVPKVLLEEQAEQEGGPVLLQAAQGRSGESSTARKEILNGLPFPQGGRGPAETQK